MAHTPGDNTDTQKPSFILTASKEEIAAGIRARMEEVAAQGKGKVPVAFQPLLPAIIDKNTEVITGFVHEAAARAKEELKTNPNLDVASFVANSVEKNLRDNAANTDAKFIVSMTTPFGEIKQNVIALTSTFQKEPDYYMLVREAVRNDVAQNLQAHPAEMAALKPQPPAAPAPAPATVAAETKPEPAPAQVASEEPKATVAAPPPAKQSEPVVAVAPLPPQPPASSPSDIDKSPAAPLPPPPETRVAETKPAPAPSPAERKEETAAPSPAQAAPPRKEKPGVLAQIGNAIIPSAQAADEVPPVSPPPSTPAPAPVADTAPPPPQSSPAPTATPEMQLPGSLPELSAMMTALPPGVFGTMLPMLQNMFNTQEATRDPASPAGQFRKTRLEPMIRDAVKKAVGDSAAFEKDIPAMAAVLQESGQEWLSKNAQTLQNGNLSREQIHDLSRDLATGVRSRMTKERVGRFADTGPLGMIDVAEMVTGIDKDGKVTRPYEMNIFGMGETALASQSASEEAKTRYQQELAYAESNRRWRAGSGRFGLSADAAGRTAAAIAADNGYESETQAAVGNMAQQEFRPGWWDWLMSLLENFLNTIIGNIAGLFGFKAEEGHKFVELNDWEKTSAQKNATLFRKILREPDPANLGYTGDPAGFEAWKQKLATDVTGIHLSKEGYLIDHNGGQVRGLTAALLGLSPDGRGTAPGTEGIEGLVPDAAQRVSAPTSPLQPTSAPAAPGTGTWAVPGTQGISYQPGTSDGHGLPYAIPGTTGARSR